MLVILFYSLLLIAGICGSQLPALNSFRQGLSGLTTLCLSYIMLEVGLEFTIHKDRLKDYLKDFSIASTAAIFPWILSAVYLGFFFHLEWKEAALIGLAAAPTSAGVLFTMLSAAGLGATWMFQKARILAVLDDLVTILLMIPLQIALVGFKMELLWVIAIILFLLFVSYRWFNVLRVPVGRVWLFLYGALVVVVIAVIERTAHVHLAVLLPAFALGCVIYKTHHAQDHSGSIDERAPNEPAWSIVFDRGIKGLFMFLVGCSLPKIELGTLDIKMIVIHLLLLTFLANLGKSFPMLCYRKEAPLRSRVALGIAMYPRGEVGAGVLLVAITYGFAGVAASLAVLSLALNLLLTGIFILVVFKLLQNSRK